MKPDTELLETLKIEFEKRILKNGLEVIVVEDHRVPVVSVSVWYRVGSRYEYPGISGISHILEHMMFKGTDRYGPEEFSKIIQSLGGYDNASTWKDETAYYSEVPSSKIEIPLEMEADRMRNLAFFQFEEELEVIKEERKLRVDNNPEGKLVEEIFLTAYSAHPYRIPVIGFESDLEEMTVDKVKNYYLTHYSPRNAFLVIVGDVKSNQAFELVEKYFGGLQNRGEIDHTITKEPPQEGLKIRELRDKNGLLKISTFSYHIPEFAHEDYPAISILSDILGGGKSSRLYKRLVFSEQVAANIDVSPLSLKDPGLLIIFGYWNQDASLDKGEQLLREEIEKIALDGVSDEEVEKSRKKVIANFVYKQESILGMGLLLGEYTILMGPEGINQYPKKLLEVTPEDVKKVAQKYLKDDNLTIVRMMP